VGPSHSLGQQQQQPSLPLLVMFLTGGSFCAGLDKALPATEGLGFPVSQEVVFLGLDK